MGNYEYEPIKKLKENNKKKMFFMFLTIFMFLGISLATIYFVYRFNDERENTITSGLVDIDFKELSPSINLQNTVPMADEIGKQNDPYIFTVENISKIPLRLKIGIDILNSTIDLSAIRYALYIDNEEIKVDNLGNLDSENNFHIIEQFASGAKIEAKLVFWIDYYYEKAGGTFSGKIRVEGEQYDIIYEGQATDTIKEKVVSNITDTCTEPGFNGGLVAINTDGTLYQENSEQEIREYRYVGPEVNNYIYFNCQDGKEQNGDNCEVWRILGIFKDESGAEHIKIVKNEISNRSVWDRSSNDWTTALLKNNLNTEYYENLSMTAKSMIEESKYYLGNFDGTKSTITNYTYERGNAICTPSADALYNDRKCNGGDIWEGNKAEWNGNIALMYPSDYGYTVNSCNWTTALSQYSSISDTSWFKTANTIHEWLLSPFSEYFSGVAFMFDNFVNWNNVIGSIAYGVRPCLYLISDVKIIDGDGTVDRPYQLTY